MTRLLVLAMSAAALWACTGPAAAAEPIRVYSSFPLAGGADPFMGDLVRSAQLALAERGGRAGAFGVQYVSLDSASADGGFDFDAVERNAELAAADPRAVLYLGEFNSGPTRFAIPILNRANIAQISPSTTFDGLTISSPFTEPGEPGVYYPTGVRTFIRLVPNDQVQGAALVTEMRQDGCARLALADDADSYGHGLARTVESHAARLGLAVVVSGQVLAARDAKPFTDRAARAGADCFMWSGFASGGGVSVTKAVAARLRSARLYGGDGVCEELFTRAIKAVATRFECANSALPAATFPGGPGFVEAFAAAYGGAVPGPYAIAAYESMKLGLDAIASLGPRGDRREAVRKALFATRARASVLGRYSVLPSGDFTLRDYSFYRGTSRGLVIYDHKVVAG